MSSKSVLAVSDSLFVCSTCGLLDKRGNDLLESKRHGCFKENNEDNEDIKSAVHVEGILYVCAECGIIMKTESDMSRHIKEVHRGVKPLKCAHCKYETLRIHDMKRHMMRKQHQVDF